MFGKYAVQYIQLKNAFHSARIEGNDLTWQEVEHDYFKKQIASLFPLRYQIYNRFIQRQKLIPSKALYEQFHRINERTLRYHLKELQNLGLIKKRGTTRGAYYEAN